MYNIATDRLCKNLKHILANASCEFSSRFALLLDKTKNSPDRLNISFRRAHKFIRRLAKNRFENQFILLLDFLLAPLNVTSFVLLKV